MYLVTKRFSNNTNQYTVKVHLHMVVTIKGLDENKLFQTIFCICMQNLNINCKIKYKLSVVLVQT